MTGLRFLFRVTLRRLDLAEEIYHIKEPQKIPVVMSPDEARRLLAAHSDDRDHLFRRIATTRYDRSRPAWRGREGAVRFIC